MRSYEDIIEKPIVTEKSHENMAQGKYTFRVVLDATKIEIKRAVENLFGVKVIKVATMRYEGKNKRQGAHEGKTSNWKKAIVWVDANPSTEKYLTKGKKEVVVNKKYNTSIEAFHGTQA